MLRFFPLSLRARIGIEVLAEIFNRYTGFLVGLGEGRERYFFTIESGGFCWGRQTDAPACGYVVGLIEEVLFWIIDIVSKGGNYMLNIGPRGDGSIPEVIICIS